MIDAILLLALQAVSSPAPPPTPVQLDVDHSYTLDCTITPRSGESFAIRVAVKGRGKKRQASVTTSDRVRFPSGRAKSRGAFTYGVPRPDRYREAFYLAGPGGEYVLNIWWFDGKPSEVGTWIYQGMGKPQGDPGRARCDEATGRSKS